MAETGTPEVTKLCESSDGLLAVKKMDDQSADVEQPGKRCVSDTVKKTIIGLVIVILLAVSWVGAQQFIQSAVRLHSFDAPYFATWYGTCWMVMCFPGYILFVAVAGRDRSKVKDAAKKSLYIFGSLPVGLKLFFTRIWTLNVLWLGVNYLYVFGLKYIAATDASAIMASNVAFVYILSLCLLREKFHIIRVLASVFCIAGVVLFAYSEGFVKTSATGIIMIIISALGAAIYKVVFKKLVGDASLGQVSLFLTLLGVSNMFIMWAVLPCLYMTGVEHFAISDIPWRALNLSSLLSLAFNFLVNFGIAYTYPLFVSIAMMLGIPLNAGVDVIVRGVNFTPMRLIAALFVIIGFCLLLIPDTWNNSCTAAVTCKKDSDEGEGQDAAKVDPDEAGVDSAEKQSLNP